MIFSALKIGDTFDFIGPDPMLNSFYRPCRKISARKYRDDQWYTHTIGSGKAQVYHVNETPGVEQ